MKKLLDRETRSAKQEGIWSIEEKQEGYCGWSRREDGTSNWRLHWKSSQEQDHVGSVDYSKDFRFYPKCQEKPLQCFKH